MSIIQPPKKILIAEDELPLQKLLARQFKTLNYTILIANNGKEALEIIESENPDLILLDIIMPIKNGYDVLQELRYVQKKQTPVIIVSNLKSPQDIGFANSFGVSAHINKFDNSLYHLKKTVEQILNEPRRHINRSYKKT